MALSIKTLDRICLVIVVLVPLICGYWFVSQGVKQRRHIRQQTALLSGSLKDLALAETNLQRLDVAIAAARKELRALNASIPDSAKIGEFLKQLDAMVKKREIVLESFQPQPVVRDKLYAKIPLRLIYRGSFVNIYNLLYDLETMNRMVEVEKIGITKSKTAEECRFDLTASIFTR
jgi:Tfp pilus assembly protein PilO